MYKIAQYLTDDEKRSALDYEYDEDYGDYCPLGVALYDRMPSYVPVASKLQPPPWAVAEAIVPPPDEFGSYDFELRKKVENAARGFTRRWDTGRIKDLAKALGLKT